MLSGGSTGGDVPFSGDNMEGRGDLAGGQDVERNAQVAALKKAFYNSEAPDRAGGGGGFAEGTGQVSLLGVLRDMPVCRWEMHMLPGFNHVLNVWQPMYTHMFEAILAQKQPWYYVHLQTPGGTKNLMHPDFNLDDPTSKAPRVGTLMRVVGAERREDSRLTCVVQGLARVRVLEQTQQAPYVRATVQLLPDAELTMSCYPLANALLKGSSADVSDSGGGGSAADWWVHTVAHAAAVSSEIKWLQFEAAPVSIRGGGEGAGGVSQLVPFSSDAGIESLVAAKIRDCQSQAVEEAASLAAAVQARAGHVTVMGAPVLSTTDLVLAGVLGGAISGAKLEAWDGWIEGAEGQVHVLEQRLWVEIDLLIRNLRRLQERSKRLMEKGMTEAETGELPKGEPQPGMDLAPQVPVPSQMMGLLPPPPQGGWPEGFMLDRVAKEMQESETWVGTASLSKFVRVGPEYDAQRRAQRLSYVASCLLGLDQGYPAQALLEARSTQHRLAMVLKVVIDINAQLE